MRDSQKQNKRKQPWFIWRGTYFDYPTLFLILFLVCFGLVMVYSSSSYKGNIVAGDSGYYFKRQVMYAAGGFIAMIGVSFFNYKKYKDFSVIFMIVEAILLVLVFFMGSSSNGSTRWIDLGFISFQPSEIAKLVLPIYMANVCTAKTKELNSLFETAKIMVFPGLMVVAIAMENLSTAVICFAIIAGVWFIATPKLIYVAWVAGAGVLLGVVGIGLVGYRGDRIEAWLNPETSEKGYQTMQSLYAIGSGGLFGRGLGQSIQKMGFIPEAYNDMIFSVICEELGVVGAAAIIVVFLMLIWRFKFIAEGSPDRFGGLLISGYIVHIAVQVIINVAVVTNVMPNTGVTLPFVSYGGTSLVFLMIEMGIVLSVSRQIRPESINNARQNGNPARDNLRRRRNPNTKNRVRRER